MTEWRAPTNKLLTEVSMFTALVTVGLLVASGDNIVWGTIVKALTVIWGTLTGGAF